MYILILRINCPVICSPGTINGIPGGYRYPNSADILPTLSSSLQTSLSATAFYGDPTSKMELVGVTGTNGKTTIATLLYNTFRHFGYKVGLISTVCNYIDDRAIPTEHTTPDPIRKNWSIKQMESRKKKLLQKIEELNNEEIKDDVMYFEETGVDALFVDEAHLFKNCAKRCRTR